MEQSLALKKSNCKNCYKCIRRCPVKSIKFSGNQARILNDECILCGQCFVVCPQNAKEIVDETEKVKAFLQANEKTIISLAPSFIANYNGIGINSLRKAIKQLGFFDVEETAIGATIIKKEYEKMVAKGDRDIIITSCCHSVNLLIQKYYPELLPYLADVVSPMLAHGMDIKNRYADCKVVFVGPCVAKKDEAQRNSNIIDAVLTFEDLSNLLKENNISIENSCDNLEESKARLFPTTGGILKTMALSSDKYTYVAIDGTENCISALNDIKNGNVHNCFIEMSACIGSCIGGPVMEKYHRSPIKDYVTVSNYAGKKDFNVKEYDHKQLKKEVDKIDTYKPIPSNGEILEILKKMGKTSVSDELNCGSCGYNTCREKAIAIYQGKADVSMCLPYLKDKGEKFTNSIVNNIPNGLVVLNEDLEIQQVNNSAKRILNINYIVDVLGEQVMTVLDPNPFILTRQNGKGVKDEKMYLSKCDKYIELTTVYEKEYRNIIGIIRDITEIEKQKARKEEISKKTLETADKVVDKQMRVVQEIASLLGETVAETKIALSKLKETIKDE